MDDNRSGGSTEYDDTDSEGENEWFDGHENVVGNFTKTFKVPCPPVSFR
jgi:hypothetical protein